MAATLRHLRRRKRVTATVISLGLHLLLVAFLLPHATRSGGLSSGDSVDDGDGRGAGAEFTLYDVASPTPKAFDVKVQAPEDTEPLDVTDVASVLPTEQTDVAVLDVTTSDLDTSLPDRPDQPIPASAPSDAASAVNNGANGSNGQSKGTRNDDQLWKAIEPCWNQLADSSTVDVTLQVNFSALGNPAQPALEPSPDGGQPNARVQRSEDQAIAALYQCGPYLFAYGRENVEIEFPVKSN